MKNELVNFYYSFTVTIIKSFKIVTSLLNRLVFRNNNCSHLTNKHDLNNNYAYVQVRNALGGR